MKFAGLHGVKYPSFANWVQRRKRQRLQRYAGTSGTPPDMDSDSAGSASRLHALEAVVAGGAAGSSGRQIRSLYWNRTPQKKFEWPGGWDFPFLPSHIIPLSLLTP